MSQGRSPGRAGTGATLCGLPLRVWCAFLLFLVAIDSLGTLLILRADRGVEVNPLMAHLLELGEVPFVVTRLIVAGLCTGWVLWRADRPYARIALLAGFALYLPIVAMHIYSQATHLDIATLHPQAFVWVDLSPYDGIAPMAVSSVPVGVLSG